MFGGFFVVRKYNIFGGFLKAKVLLDELMKPKFYKRCQSTISDMKIRLNIVRKRKNAMIKFLKMDISDLLKMGLDYNAYTRTEGIIEEQKRVSCYDLIERFCDTVFANLSLMLKQQEFPEECREAVSSLIYAAARVAEVPELKELRASLTEKYGNFDESSVNKELIEKLGRGRPSREEKIQKMREIAGEFSIRWDSEALQQFLIRQSSALQIEQKDQTSDQNNNDQHIETETKKNALEGRAGQRYGGDMKMGMNGDSSSEDESILSRSWRSSSSSSSQGTLSEEEEEEADKKKKRTLSYRFIPPPYPKPGARKDEDPQEKKKKKNTDRTGESARRRFLRPQGTDNFTSTSNNEASSSGFRDSGSKNDAISDLKQSDQRTWKLPDYDEVVGRMNALRRRSKQKQS